MKRKPSLALLALCALPLAGVAAAESPDYLRLKRARAGWEVNGTDKTVSIKLETRQTVPMDGRAGAFGYAALSSDGNNVLVLVTHLPIDDSSHEQNPSGFHTHVLDLKPPSSACKDATFEVDLEGSGKNTAFDADYQWSIVGAGVRVQGIPAADLADAGIEKFASFRLQPVLDGQRKATNLCVQVVEQI